MPGTTGPALGVPSNPPSVLSSTPAVGSGTPGVGSVIVTR